MANLEPRRFILKAQQVSEGFAAAGCSPPRSPAYAELPTATGKLPELLQDENGTLDPEAKKLFQTIASPEVVGRYSLLGTGQPLVLEMRLLGHKDGHYALVGRPDDHSWDLAFLPGEGALLALLDDLLLFGEQPSLEAEFSMSLDLPSLTILAGLAELVRRSKLRAELDGKAADLEFITGPLPVQAILALVESERSRANWHSPISQLGLASDGALFEHASAKSINAGLEQMEYMGLIDSDTVPTSTTIALVSLLATRSAIANFAVSRRVADGLVTDTLTFLMGSGSIVTGAWKCEETGVKQSLLLTSSTGTKLLEVLRDLLVPQSAERPKPNDVGAFCPNCGDPHASEQNFCRSCGAELAD